MNDPVAQDVTLTGRAEVLPDRLRIRYVLTNKGSQDVYVLDAFPAVEPEERRAFADLNGAFVCAGAPGAVQVLKGIAPLPEDRKVGARVIPLGTKVAPGEKLERAFEFPLPLREQSPYDGPAEAKECEEREVKDVVLTVHLLRQGVEGFDAEPVPYAPGYFWVRGQYTAGQAEQVQGAFSVPPVKFLKRQGRFSRI
jgi:hypothetical protein